MRSAPSTPPIAVRDKIERQYCGELIEQSVAHITGIAIPAMLEVGGGGQGAAAGASPTGMYCELSAAFDALEEEERKKHDLYDAFSKLPKPSASAPPSWYLECGALWYACASPEKGNLFEYSQIVGAPPLPPGARWDWLTSDNAQQATACLREHIRDYCDPGTVAKELLSCSVASTTSTGLRRERSLQSQLHLRTPTAVWVIKCAQGSLKDADKLELALQAYMWLHKTQGAGGPPVPILFKLINALSGEVWELVLTREETGGERVWDQASCEGLSRCAQRLIDKLLLGEAPLSPEAVVARHSGDRARFRGALGPSEQGGGAGGGVAGESGSVRSTDIGSSIGSGGSSGGGWGGGGGGGGSNGSGSGPISAEDIAEDAAVGDDIGYDGFGLFSSEVIGEDAAANDDLGRGAFGQRQAFLAELIAELSNSGSDGVNLTGTPP